MTWPRVGASCPSARRRKVLFPAQDGPLAEPASTYMVGLDITPPALDLTAKEN